MESAHESTHVMLMFILSIVNLSAKDNVMNRLRELTPLFSKRPPYRLATF